MKTLEEVLEKQGLVLHSIRGMSMMPLLRQDKDAVVIVKKEKDLRCEKYDAVLFKRKNGSYVLHRIVEVLEDGYIIVGDNAPKREYVKEEQILGVLSEINRGGKKLELTDWRYRLYVSLWYKVPLVRRGYGLIRRVVRRVIRK